jgi:deazaflavin-dependent oxidoreductase (nitroreductase family)
VRRLVARLATRRPIARLVDALHTPLYRVTRGALGGSLLGAPVLLLTTRGRRTGQPRTNPVLFVEDGERLVVAASDGGRPRPPAWYLNLVAEPRVEARVGRRVRQLRARAAAAEERERYWPQLDRIWPFELYRARSAREIAVVVLEPAPPGEG